MANREQRGNREKRKPKAEKPKGVAQSLPFGQHWSPQEQERHRQETPSMKGTKG